MNLVNRCRIDLLIILFVLATVQSARPDSDRVHMAMDVQRPVPWPDGLIPFDIGKLSQEQQATVKQAMQRWMDTGARIAFVPRTSQREYVEFTGRTDAGNNTSHNGFKAGARAEVNITSFWWRQGEWMPAHELGHVLGFHHEHARWDRDAYVTIHYEHIKEGRQGDYDWIPQANWLVGDTPYDYYSIMHYRVCWASRCESQCHDGDGSSPCAVIDPIGTNYDRVIGQWGENRISAGDGQKARRAYGTARTIYVMPTRGPEGNGTLAEPFVELTAARRAAPKNARFVVLSRDGAFSIAP